MSLLLTKREIVNEANKTKRVMNEEKHFIFTALLVIHHWPRLPSKAQLFIRKRHDYSRVCARSI